MAHHRVWTSFQPSSERFPIMAMVANPDDFVAWPSSQKLLFYRKAVDWHHYIQELQQKDSSGHAFVEEAWGTQTFPGMAVNAGKVLLIALYNATFDEFSQLIMKDPLWDFAVYQAPALLPVTHEFAKNDYQDDLDTHMRLRARVSKQLNTTLSEPNVAFAYEDKIPDVKPGGPLRFMVTLQNTDDYSNLSDLEKLRQDERVLQMHTYHGILRERGIITHEWGCYQNYGFGLDTGQPTKGGRHIYQVNTVNEFDALLLLDPMRDVSALRTLMLLPLEESRRRISQLLSYAESRLKQ